MYVFIVNPVAGNGKAKRVFDNLAQTERYKQLSSTIQFTRYEGHAEEIAAECAASKEQITCIIVISGDGTFHEVINGLGDYRIPLTFIPGGSGNDFARGVGIKGQPEKMLEQIVRGKNTIAYWTGSYTADNQAKRQFVNSMGFGFDAEISDQANRPSFKRTLNRLHLSKLNYVIALLRVLFRFKPNSFELELDGEKQTINDCWMITIANHPFYGGGMKIIPGASNTPESMHILVLQSISKWKVLAMFMTIFTGKHIRFKEVALMQANQITIRTENELYFHADGEADRCTQATISKNKKAFTIHGIHSSKNPTT